MSEQQEPREQTVMVGEGGDGAEKTSLRDTLVFTVLAAVCIGALVFFSETLLEYVLTLRFIPGLEISAHTVAIILGALFGIAALMGWYDFFTKRE